MISSPHRRCHFAGHPTLVADRAANVIVVVDTSTDPVVIEIDLAGAVSADRTPVLLAASPSGAPHPLLGTPGLSEADRASGRLQALAPISHRLGAPRPPILMRSEPAPRWVHLTARRGGAVSRWELSADPLILRVAQARCRSRADVVDMDVVLPALLGEGRWRLNGARRIGWDGPDWDYLLTERCQGETGHLEAGDTQRDADDSQAEQETGQQMP